MERDGKLNSHRYGHTATLLQDGKVLVAGGFSDSDTGVLDSAELYDPDTGTWNETGKLNTHRYGHTATLLQNGKILVAGGVDNATLSDEYPVLSSAELYDPDTETWKATGSLNTRREGDPATLLHSGKVLVAGRYTAELYDPETGTWSLTDSTRLAPHTRLLFCLTAGSWPPEGPVRLVSVAYSTAPNCRMR